MKPEYQCLHLKASSSVEACSANVFKGARENGFPIEVVRTCDEDRNTFGRF
jgi:hypothetical protein